MLLLAFSTETQKYSSSQSLLYICCCWPSSVQLFLLIFHSIQLHFMILHPSFFFPFHLCAIFPFSCSSSMLSSNNSVKQIELFRIKSSEKLMISMSFLPRCDSIRNWNRGIYGVVLLLFLLQLRCQLHLTRNDTFIGFFFVAMSWIFFFLFHCSWNISRRQLRVGDCISHGSWTCQHPREEVSVWNSYPPRVTWWQLQDRKTRWLE